VGADGSLELVNAGHPAALLLGAGGIESVAGTGLPLGLFGGGEFGSVRRRLERGDVLLLYTDGVSEAHNGAGEEFGCGRVATALERAAGGSAEDVVDAVLADLERHRGGVPLTDDVTVMALRRID
jgi:sigma-B regulation protein RsbU (phosphoserine phosphatase)